MMKPLKTLAEINAANRAKWPDARSRDQRARAGDWNAYPSYSLAELESMIGRASSPEAKAKMEAEIKARKDGTSTQRRTPTAAPGWKTTIAPTGRQ